MNAKKMTEIEMVEKSLNQLKNAEEYVNLALIALHSNINHVF